ncbi:hypothetical protein ACE3NQ_03530 [Paenibacillus terreus]|uniref:Sugar ABC transporter permease n=1 Tax=Paenibacillus terreus TaxID=1387834 RepID=A0ABV5B5U9_9BACL
MKNHKLFDVVNNTFIATLSFVCTLPLLLVLIVSITDERSIQSQGYSFFPNQLSFDAYRLLFSGSSPLLQSYLVSITVTVVGTLLAVTININGRLYAGGTPCSVP